MERLMTYRFLFGENLNDIFKFCLNRKVRVNRKVREENNLRGRYGCGWKKLSIKRKEGLWESDAAI